MKCLSLREACVEDHAHASIYGILYPALKLCVDLLIGHFQVVEEHVPAR